MRKTIKQLEAEIQELETKLQKLEASYDYAVKISSELRSEIASVHYLFNELEFDAAVETDGYSSMPNMITRFGIYQNHLLNKFIKTSKVKK